MHKSTGSELANIATVSGQNPDLFETDWPSLLNVFLPLP
jgi:hypothetical protein